MTTERGADVIVDLALVEARAVSGVLAQLAEIAAQPAHGRDHLGSGG